MGAVAGVGLYRPGHVVDGRRVLGPDEDTFTLAVTASELLPAPAFSGTIQGVELVGDLPPVAEWGFGVLLGGRVSVTRHAPGKGGAVAAVEAALRSDGGTVVLVVDRGDGPDAGGDPGGAGTVAVAFGGSRAEVRAGARVRPSEEVSALATVLEWARSHVDVAADDSVSPDPDPTTDERAAWGLFRATPTTVVSEGAYVPIARYRENLPSRWGLVADRCGACGALTFPARGVCRHCGRTDSLTAERLPRDGAKVVARTTIGKGGQPTEFDPQVAALGTYDVVLAEWPGGARVTLPVADSRPGQIHIGDPVRTRLRRLYAMEGEWRYGRKALPSSRSAGNAGV